MSAKHIVWCATCLKKTIHLDLECCDCSDREFLEDKAKVKAYKDEKIAKKLVEKNADHARFMHMSLDQKLNYLFERSHE